MGCKPGSKSPLRTFDPNTAFHEAGHVVAHCHIGEGIESAHVLPRGQTEMTDNRGRTVRCCGLTQPRLHFNENKLGFSSIEQFLTNCPDELRQLSREAFIDRGTRVIICGYAGPCVEARKRRRSLFAVMSLDGRDDFEEVDSILKWLAPDNEVRKQLTRRCDQIVKRFLREPDIRQQVDAVANILIRDGAIDGDHPLLAGIGGMCPLSKWSAV